MVPTLNFDAVLSDPLLILAAVLLVVGPIVFIVALFKFLSWERKQKQSAEFDELHPFSAMGPAPTDKKIEPVVVPPPYMKPEEAPTPPPVVEAEIPPKETVKEKNAERTIIVPAGTGEIQGQLEIAFSQIKTLNKKVAQVESELESVARNVTGKLEKNELKEVPMNPADFTQKLLKLAEHVIVLEKEVERLKNISSKKENSFTSTLPPNALPDELASAVAEAPSLPSAPKPPVMPL